MKNNILLTLMHLLIAVTAFGQRQCFSNPRDTCYSPSKWTTPGCQARIIDSCHSLDENAFYQNIRNFSSVIHAPKTFHASDIQTQLSGKKPEDVIYLTGDFTIKDSNSEIAFTNDSSKMIASYSVAFLQALLDGRGKLKGKKAKKFYFYKALHSSVSKDIIFKVYNGHMYWCDVSDAYPLR